MGALPRRFRPRRALLGLLVLTLALAACSPEAARDFGEGRGSGADTGNRGDDVELHAQEEREDQIYYHTPDDRPPVADSESG